MISIGIPLFIVTMTSQNLPGVTVLKANGYEPPISPMITWLGLSTVLFAPFGCFSICLAAITGAITSGAEADRDPKLRYRATIFAGICWIAFGIFGATIVALFATFPQALVIALAGFALLSTIGNSLHAALDKIEHREPALVTILVAASGITLFNIGSGFWGLIAGIFTLSILNWRKGLPILGSSAPAS